MKKRTRIYNTLAVFIGVMLVSCIVAFIMLCINGAKSDIYVTPIEKELDASSYPAELSSTYDYGDIYLKSMVFVTDRSTYGLLNSDESKEKIRVWTSSDGHLPLDFNINTTAIVTNGSGRASIPEAAGKYKPQYILLSIGLENGVEHCSEKKFKEYYIKLIDSIKVASPETKIILQSILPVSKSAQKNSPNISNEKINTANIWIAEVAQMNGVKYLNTASVLKDSKGFLDHSYDGGDGISLNENGVSVMLQYVKTHGYRD
jgi:hypothetical protein